MNKITLTSAQADLLRAMQRGVFIVMEMHKGRRHFYRSDTSQNVNKTAQALYDHSLIRISVGSMRLTELGRYWPDLPEKEKETAE